MNRFLLFCILLIVAASGLQAQTVVVRSGEHETFTRLVMKLKDGVGWSITRSNRLARVDIDQPDIRLDIAAVFQKIPRKRLLALKQRENGAPLELSLNCNCEVESFAQPGNYLVIDIRDPKPDEALLSPRLPPIGIASYRFNLGEGTARARLTHVGDLRRPESLAPPVANPPSAGAGGTLVRSSFSEQRLLAQIQRATSQGLLTPVAHLVPQPPDSVSEKTETAPSPTPQINIATTTVIDRDMASVASVFDQFTNEPECLPAEFVAISDWGNDRPFSDQVSQHRIRLFEEFDRLNSAAVTDLAKTYLYFGFGDEARAVLALLSETDEQTDVLLALADVLDDRPVAQGELLSGQSGCSPGSALWSALAQPDDSVKINSDAVLQGFSHLPRHLRQQLGPRFSRQFNSLGRRELASDVLRAVDRSADSSGPPHDLAAAEIEIATGQSEAAVEKMEKVVVSDSELSPEALIKLIDTLEAERRPLRPDFPELAAAYAAEHRLGELEAELRRIHATSLAMVGRFDEAFRVLGELMELGSKIASDRATNSVLNSLTENADDVTFLTFVLPRAKSDGIALSSQLETKMAERLLSLGFAEQAYAMLKPARSDTLSKKEQLLRAEIALANGLPHRAMIEVLNLKSLEASEIRARAMRANGDFDTAGQVLLDAARPETAARNLWLGDAWESLPTIEDPQYSRLAELSSQLALQIDTDDAIPPLAAARTLLDDSMNARSGIDEMLGTLQVPNPAE